MLISCCSGCLFGRSRKPESRHLSHSLTAPEERKRCYRAWQHLSQNEPALLPEAGLFGLRPPRLMEGVEKKKGKESS
jgi:hypothetical protein